MDQKGSRCQHPDRPSCRGLRCGTAIPLRTPCAHHELGTITGAFSSMREWINSRLWVLLPRDLHVAAEPRSVRLGLGDELLELGQLLGRDGALLGLLLRASLVAVIVALAHSDVEDEPQEVAHAVRERTGGRVRPRHGVAALGALAICQ